MAEQSRVFTKFPQHVDNALEKVHGEHINEIQEAVNIVQGDTSTLYSKTFLNDCIFVLQNNPSVNYMFYMNFENQDDVLRSKSQHYKHDTTNRCVYVTQGQQLGTIHSIEYKSAYGQVVNDYILKVDAIIPKGATIRYFISDDLVNYYPLKAGDSVPKRFKSSHEQVYIKAELIKNSNGESPKLFGLALLCFDRSLDSESLITTPDEDDETVPGETTLIYDPNNDNRLDMVITATGAEVKLIYDGNGELTRVIKEDSAKTTTNELVKEVVGEETLLKSVITTITNK